MVACGDFGAGSGADFGSSNGVHLCVSVWLYTCVYIYSKFSQNALDKIVAWTSAREDE